MHKQRVKKSVDSTFNEANNIMISMIFFYRNYACSVLYFCPLKTVIDACVISQPVKLSFFSVFILLLGLSKETPELKFASGFVLLIVRSQIAIKSSSRIRNLLTATHA